MIRAIICIVIGWSIGLTIAHVESLTKQASKLRMENQELRRDIEKLRIRKNMIVREVA